VAIFCQPSILRNLICPLATRLKSSTTAASSLGREPCVFTRRRNSSWSRSIVFVVRSVFYKAPDVLALLDHTRRWSRPGSPFVERWRTRSVTWVEPRLEAEVSYAEIVEGRLRAPSWRGFADPHRVLSSAVKSDGERGRVGDA
jgi:hypothetical protein